MILSWSRFRISLLLSIKNDVKCACRKLHSAVHTCIYPKTPGHTSKKFHDALEEKKTLNDAPSHHANALTQQLCMHTTNHCAMTTSRRCAVDNSTSYNALSRKHNFAHNASLLLCLLSRCRAVIRASFHVVATTRNRVKNTPQFNGMFVFLRTMDQIQDFVPLRRNPRICYEYNCHN